MKKTVLFPLFLLMSVLTIGQNNLKNESSYYGFDKLPSTSSITLSEGFKLNTQNHPLDSIKGSITNDFKKKPTIKIKQKHIGRIVFYAKNKFLNKDSLFNQSVVNGSINIKYLKLTHKDTIIKLQEDISLKSNWIEYHKYLEQPDINEIHITFKAEDSSTTELLFDKLKITELTEEGVSFYENKIKNEQILLSTVNKTNYTEQSKAIYSTYDKIYINNLCIYRQNIREILYYDNGRSLGLEKSRILNPFDYNSFKKYYKELEEKASYAQELELENIEQNIDNNNWLDIAGNVINLITGGTFNKLVNTIKSIANEQIITFGKKKIQIRKIDGRFYTVKKGSLKTLSSYIKDPNEQKKIIKDFNKEINTNNDYVNFLSSLEKMRVLEIQNKEIFKQNSLKIKELIDAIDVVLNKIIKEADTNSNITSFYTDNSNSLNTKTYSEHFTKNYNYSVSDISSLVDKKIQFSIIKREYSQLMNKIEKVASETKTLYDNSFTTNSLNKNLFVSLKGNNNIANEWKKRVKHLENEYKKSLLLQKIKNITKNE